MKKLNYDISSIEYYDKDGETIFVGLFLNEKEFILDVDDLKEICDIFKTVSENMDKLKDDMVPSLNLYECLICPLKIFEGRTFND